MFRAVTSSGEQTIPLNVDSIVFLDQKGNIYDLDLFLFQYSYSWITHVHVVVDLKMKASIP
jgi:hypothetical protein